MCFDCFCVECVCLYSVPWACARRGSVLLFEAFERVPPRIVRRIGFDVLLTLLRAVLRVNDSMSAEDVTHGAVALPFFMHMLYGDVKHHRVIEHVRDIQAAVGGAMLLV